MWRWRQRFKGSLIDSRYMYAWITARRCSMFLGFRLGPEATGRKLHYCIQILFRVTKSLVQKLGSPGVENIPIIFKICIMPNGYARTHTKFRNMESLLIIAHDMCVSSVQWLDSNLLIMRPNYFSTSSSTKQTFEYRSLLEFRWIITNFSKRMMDWNFFKDQWMK